MSIVFLTPEIYKFTIVWFQFRLPEENQLLQKFFSTFYCTVNLGGFMGMVVTPALRRSVMCFGDDACYALGFGFPALLVLISIGESFLQHIIEFISRRLLTGTFVLSRTK